MRKISLITAAFILFWAVSAGAYDLTGKVVSVGPAPGGVFIGIVPDGSRDSTVFQANPAREKEMEAVALVANAISANVMLRIESQRVGRTYTDIITTIFIMP